MKGKASDICPKCKHCEGLDKFTNMYSCKHYNNYPDSAIGINCEIECANFEEVNMNKVEGKVGDFCLNCKNCKAVTRIHDGKNASIRIIEVDCEDPYDGMVKTLDVDSDIRCSMFEPNSPCDKISLLQHELEMDRLRRTIHQLEKEKAVHLKGIERLKKSQEKLQNQVKNLKVEAEENETMYNDLNYWKERCHNAETDVTTLNSKVEVLKNKNDKYLKKIIDQQMTDYKQRARILELECAVNKLQSGEYDDILAKDIEIKSLQTKYGDVMSGWNHTMELYEKLKNEVDKLKNENTSLNAINKGLAEDRKKLINYIRSLKIASDNYLKEFTYKED